jgi:predicted nucleic-acid-binding protein
MTYLEKLAIIKGRLEKTGASASIKAVAHARYEEEASKQGIMTAAELEILKAEIKDLSPDAKETYIIKQAEIIDMLMAANAELQEANAQLFNRLQTKLL